MSFEYGVPVLLFLPRGTAACTQTPGTGAIAGAISDPAHRVLLSAPVTAVEEATHLAH